MEKDLRSLLFSAAIGSISAGVVTMTFCRYWVPDQLTAGGISGGLIGALAGLTRQTIVEALVLGAVVALIGWRVFATMPNPGDANPDDSFFLSIKWGFIFGVAVGGFAGSAIPERNDESTPDGEPH